MEPTPAIILDHAAVKVLADFTTQARDAMPLIFLAAVVIAALGSLLAHRAIAAHRTWPTELTLLLFDCYRVVSIWGLFVAAASLLLLFAPGSFIYAHVLGNLCAAALLLALRFSHTPGRHRAGER